MQLSLFALLVVVVLLSVGSVAGGYYDYWPRRYGYGGAGIGLIAAGILIAILLR